MARSFARLGVFAALLMTTGCLGYVAGEYPPPPPPSWPPRPIAVENADLNGPGYGVMPKPNPRRAASRAGQSAAEGRKSTSNADTAALDKPSAGQKAADAKPLTPAEIRAAIPLQKVSNPQQTLSDAQIKSVWGGVVGKVRSVNVSGGMVKAVEANVSGARKIVRIDPARLKYVKSRGVVLTTMSKPDVEKLPSAGL